jgi:hypothetical protein
MPCFIILDEASSIVCSPDYRTCTAKDYHVECDNLLQDKIMWRYPVTLPLNIDERLGKQMQQ